MTTYYYPSADGAAEYDPGATSAGSATFTGNLAQSPAGSYSVITANPGTDPQTYTVTLGYTGPGTGTTITTVQTPYSDANHSETFYNSPQGSVLFLLENGPVASNVSYTFSGPSAPFNTTGGSTTDPTVCFASGTRIRTARGDIAIEDLEVGDHVITASGPARPIRWLGHRHVDCRRHSLPEAVLPIRIAAHTFGESRPARNLVVSPGHAICVELLGETLIPAGALVNGSTIQQVEVDAVTYWHVELDGHDILFAENLACKSYLEMGNRGFFAEADAVTLHARPDAPIATHADFCRPFHATGPVVEAARAMLAMTAAGRGKRDRVRVA